MKNSKGFSLVELIVVIAIMAVLVGVLSPSLLRYVEKARMAKDNSAMSEYTNCSTLIMTQEKTSGEIATAINKSKGDHIKVIFYPIDGTMSAVTAVVNYETLAVSELPTYVQELVAHVGDSYQLTSSFYREIPYTIEISDNGVIGYWGLAVNQNLGVVNRDDTLRKIFELLVDAAKGGNFLIYNSNYTRSNGVINEINKQLLKAGDKTDIKTWSIFNDTGVKTSYEKSNLTYIFSTVDTSNYSEWKQGDQIPAIIQRPDGTIEVGMATLREQNDGPSPYWVISRDSNNKYAHDSGYNANDLLTGTKTFSSLEEAYAYYETLSIHKQ